MINARLLRVKPQNKPFRFCLVDILQRSFALICSNILLSEFAEVEKEFRSLR